MMEIHYSDKSLDVIAARRDGYLIWIEIMSGSEIDSIRISG